MKFKRKMYEDSARNLTKIFVCFGKWKCLCSFDFALSRNPGNLALELPMKTLPDLLEEHTLPRGLFPRDITDFTFDENTKRITVNMPDDRWQLICNSCTLQFSKTVTGLLERGKLSDINEMRTQAATWGKISCIKIRQQAAQRKELLFTTDQSELTKGFHEFEVVKNGRPF